MRIVFFLAVSFMAATCGAFKYHKRPSHLSNRPIIGGNDAEINNFPYQVSLEFILRSVGAEIHTNHFCGGSIISVEWVLTAAHCIIWFDSPRDIGVRVGTNVRSQGGYVHEVSSFVIHSSFNMRQGVPSVADVALIKVAKPFEIGPNVKPIPLSKNPLQTGRIAVVSGWGTTTERGKSPLNLQKVEVPIMPQWECKLMYKEKINEYMFCAGRAGRSACHGDSGGPLVVDGYQIGIVSWGESCELPGFSTVFANVYALRDWIHQNCGV